jgi:hypothetical protein
MGLRKASHKKIFETFFLDSQKLLKFTKNKLYLKINQKFSDNDRHLLDEDWMDLYDSIKSITLAKFPTNFKLLFS